MILKVSLITAMEVTILQLITLIVVAFGVGIALANLCVQKCHLRFLERLLLRGEERERARDRWQRDAETGRIRGAILLSEHRARTKRHLR